MGIGPASVFAWMLLNIVGAYHMTIASLNIGGDGPQPEFLGGDWEDAYGPVETALGAKILFLAFGCENGKIDEKFNERYGVELKKYCECDLDSKNCTGDNQPSKIKEAQVMEYVSEKMRKEMITKINENTKATSELQTIKGVTMVDFAKYLVGSKLKNLDNKVCKRRKVFPYFGEGFMEMYGMLYGETTHNNRDPYAVYEASREEKCSTGKAGYMPLFFYDMIILRTFHEVLGSQKPVPINYLEGTHLLRRKRDIVNKIMDQVDILFLQEASDYFHDTPKSGGKPRIDEHGEKIVAVNTGEGIDSAILLKKGCYAEDKEFVKPQKCNPEKAGSLYQDWRTYVEGKTQNKVVKDGDKISFALTNDNNDIYEYLPGKEEFKPKFNKEGQQDEFIFNVDATAVEVARLGGSDAMLMSMHPKSNGRPCVLFAAMAKEFFLEHSKTCPLDFLLLGGMDANVLVPGTDADKKRKTPKEWGYMWSEFKEAAEKLDFAVIYDEGHRKPTVWKTRTFLQTQLDKAAKVDITIKDIMLLYQPKGHRVLTPHKAEVVNWAPKARMLLLTEAKPAKHFVDSKVLTGFGYLAGSPYPKRNWPLDHFMTVAKARGGKTTNFVHDQILKRVIQKNVHGHLNTKNAKEQKDDPSTQKTPTTKGS
eukprot:CAMPEP_0179308144 /NCGR_PEP_ID=MMETSP0797-20121207/50997_1 /TAXON_ID=47934 /ORGANISM="Dinophysis acuminata, Strain DAEP01" /LENGTH=647 /DNA_ID=CAMNT_0021017833 /DNA_START=69 /DNA_END=2014 /DNA_ORIENTATION=+